MTEARVVTMGTTEGNNQQQMATNIDRFLIMEIMENFTKNQNKQLKEVIEFVVTPLKEKGDNFLSQISVLTVNYRLKESGDAGQTISFIVKRKLNMDVINQLEDSCKIFQREIQFYKEISNGFKNILQSTGENFTIGPSCLYISDDILVLENLHRLHYKLQDVKQGLNLAQFQLVMQHLAKFHGLGMMLYRMNPEMFRLHLTGNVTEYHSIYHEVYKKSLATCIEYCSQQKDLNFYIKHLKIFQRKIIEEMIKVFKRDTRNDRYHVLNHGDVWVNNILFKDEEFINSKTKSKVLFIDFQEGFYGSPGIDMNYLIFTSCPVEVFQNHLNDLLNIYHETLKDFLKKINYSYYTPSREDVRMEFLNKGFHGLATATCILPLLITDHIELVNADIFVEDSDLTLANRRLIFNNPNYAERLKVFLKYFTENHIL